MSVNFAGPLADAGATFWMPPQASTFAQDSDALFYFIYYLCVFFFFLVVGATFWFAFKYKKRSEGQRTSPLKHNTRLEVLWSAIPTVLLVVIFAWGQEPFVAMSAPPTDSMDVQVTGMKWSWTVDYPSYGKSCTNKLVVPVGEPVKITMSSVDVIHSFFIPAFRLKRDAVPNRYTGYWFEATQEGTFPLYCTEYCGTDHSEMDGQVLVKSKEDFELWLKSDDCALANPDKPEEYGPYLYKKLGCNACHSLDGSKLVGPSFEGLFGRDESLSDGSKVKVDEEYLRESIMDPNAKVVAGYGANMPSFAGRVGDKEMQALIWFIKNHDKIGEDGSVQMDGAGE